MVGRQRFFQFGHDAFSHSYFQRELFGKSYGRLFQLGVRAAFLVFVEPVNLLLREPGPLTEGLVIVGSVVTLIEQAGLQVCELPQLGIEPALKASVQRQGRVKNFRSVGHRTKDVGDHFQLCMESLEDIFCGL